MPLNLNLTECKIVVLLQYKRTSYKRIQLLRLNLMRVQKKVPENNHFEVTLFDIKKTYENGHFKEKIKLQSYKSNYINSFSPPPPQQK